MYTLLVPKNRSLKEVKPGGGNPFWKSFWEKRVSENPAIYKKQYEERVKRLSFIADSASKRFHGNEKRYYLKAKLDDLASKKSNEPVEIWKESGLHVVKSENDGSIVLSGFGDDFKKLAKIIGDANFDYASETEKVRKKNNLAREVFSVTALSDPNASLEERISEDVKDFISKSSELRLDCILTVYYDYPFSEYDSLFSLLNSKIGDGVIEKFDKDFFINNMVFRASLTAEEIRNILLDLDCNFIDFIKAVSSYSVQRTTPSVDPKSIKIGSLLTDEIAVVIDSGIDHEVLNNFVIHRENLVDAGKGQLPNKNHGTAVSSRLLFGDDLFGRVESNETFFPVSRIIDIQTLHKKGNDAITDDPTLMRAIKTSVTRYGEQASIFNLSVTEKRGVHETRRNETSELIDSLSNKHDVLFVCAAGNQNGDFPLGYEEIFNDNGVDCHIAAPADALNALTVGSITDVADIHAICNKVGHPSPFTRKGGIRNDMKKPELVAVGGNVKIDATGNYDLSHMNASKSIYGVSLIDESGFTKDVGSSFSAPLIARQAIQLLDYLKKSSLSGQLASFLGNKANLIKALLIHSTSRIDQTELTDEGLQRAYGFGQANFLNVLADNDDQVTIVYADKIEAKEKKQKILISLPKYLLGKSVELTFTFVYNPPVNRNFKEYKMIDLKPSISFLSPEVIDGVPTGKTKSIGNNPKHSWYSYRSDSFNTVHFTKKRAKLTQLDLQVMAQMTVSNRLLDEYVGHEEKISQNYAFILTIKDTSEGGVLRSEILNSNQFFELVENIAQVQVTAQH